MTTLADNNYREQPELPCCDNCKHCYINSDYETWWSECGATKEYQGVSQTAICDKYEPGEDQ
jgi:hypothetical protein